jgi:large subunit ribosomal protein L10
MALSKDKKQQVVDEVSRLLADSRLTVAARYSGTSVQAMQELRRQAKDSGTQVKVVKNRLFKKAAGSIETYKDLDVSIFSGQLVYTFNRSDEVAPASALAMFAKTHPQVEFVAGLSPDGVILNADDLKILAALPTKDELRAQTLATMSAPASGFVRVVAANMRGLLNVLNAREQSQAS